VTDREGASALFPSGGDSEVFFDVIPAAVGGLRFGP
jgi:hypothetical protein